MNKRPDLEVGDVVRLSHKGMARHRDTTFVKWSTMTMTVVAVSKAVQDGRDAVYVAYNTRGHVFKASFRRKELWLTGYNIADKGKTFTVTKCSWAAAAIKPSVASAAAKAKANGWPIWTSQQNAPKPKLPDPCKKDEIECNSCHKMADRGHVCWWCGHRN